MPSTDPDTSFTNYQLVPPHTDSSTTKYQTLLSYADPVPDLTS